MDAGKDQTGSGGDERTEPSRTDEADLSGVIDTGSTGKGADGEGRTFSGIGEDPGVIEDSADSAQAHDATEDAGPSGEKSGYGNTPPR